MHSFSFEFWSCVEDCLLPKCRHAWWTDITLIISLLLRDQFAQAISKQLSGNFSTISSFGGQHEANRLITMQKKLKVKESENGLLRTSNANLLQQLHDANERIRNLEQELESERTKFEELAVWSSHLVWQLSWAEQELQNYLQELLWSSIFEPCITA